MRKGEIQGRHYATGQPVRVRWDAGKITEVDTVSSVPEDLWIAPSLFDLQVNGYGGIDFQQDNLTQEDLLRACTELRAAGCGRFLLTLITDDWARLTARLRHLRALCAGAPALQRAIVGWHVEGPFLSAEPGFCGAHNPAFMCDPRPEHIRELRSITGSDPVVLTVAPERAGALEAIALATSLGIKVSLGHTNAPVEVLQQAVRAGAGGFTHLGNGCPQSLDRHDNILWRVLETPGLLVSLIPDQIHVSAMFFRLAHRLLDPDSIYYTTDAMAAAGAPPGTYRLGPITLEVGPDQVVRRPGQPYLAGSALQPLEAIRRASRMLAQPWQRVWPHYSSAPARLIGLRNALTAGEPADFCCVRVDEGGGILDAQLMA